MDLLAACGKRVSDDISLEEAIQVCHGRLRRTARFCCSITVAWRHVATLCAAGTQVPCLLTEDVLRYQSWAGAQSSSCSPYANGRKLAVLRQMRSRCEDSRNSHSSAGCG